MIVNQNYIVLDTETGGFVPSKNPLTQIAFIAVDSITFEEKFRFNKYIKPYDDNLYISQSASDLTGITQEKCEKEGSPLEEVLEEMNTLFKNLKVSYYLPILAGHNLSFDLMFLEDVYNRVYGVNSGKNSMNKLYDYCMHTCMDTMFLSRQKFCNNEVANFKLETIGEYIGVMNTSAHNAFSDVEQTLGLLKYFILSMRNGKDFNNKIDDKPKFNFQF